ncbi:hypothetical protein BGC07_18790 [Piscirickettsia litoralis]|uniref:Uncharacterized protein n=1 Tax=Piscirickettsia litoralis TaxID=1891921 RepID=A0ABX2ZWU1_9GAMM|nr:hypothetical protein BGC07_18790 [Piscirickettsia litoralis]
MVNLFQSANSFVLQGKPSLCDFLQMYFATMRRCFDVSGIFEFCLYGFKLLSSAKTNFEFIAIETRISEIMVFL